MNERDAIRQARKEQADLEEEYRNQLERDREKLMLMPEFRRVMADMMARGKMFQSVMTGNSHTFYNSGRQDFAREIWADLALANQSLAIDLLKPRKIGENDAA